MRMAEITGQEQQMMSNRLRLAAPLRNPFRGKCMAKIHQSHRAAFAAGNQALSKSPENFFCASGVERAPSCSDKETFATREQCLALLPIIPQRANRG